MASEIAPEQSPSVERSTTDLEVHAFLSPKMSEDAKQVLGRRVAVRPKHPHEAVGRHGRRVFQVP